MIRVDELMLGDLVRFKDDTDCDIRVEVKVIGPDYCLVSIDGDEALDDVPVDELVGIELTPEILERNGWEHREYLWILKSQPRIAWYRTDHKIIIDYHTFVIKVDYVHELQHLMKMLGIKDIEL